jgi:glucose-1-phosphate cytidylyltransferase
MKAVIFAGGRGSRLAEVTHAMPKTLVPAAGKPLIWHILANYYRFKVDRFLILTGYRGQQIQQYFMEQNATVISGSQYADYFRMEVILPGIGKLQIELLDTGEDTNTGGRLLAAEKYLEEDFFLTYGDGVSDVDIGSLEAFHRNRKQMATLTAVQPPARFGALQLDSFDNVSNFTEKPKGDGGWINGGFFVLSKGILAFLEDVDEPFETKGLPNLANAGELNAFKHSGFWQPVDTVKDLESLNIYLLNEDPLWVHQ